MAKNRTFKGAAAVAVIQGNRKAAQAVGVELKAKYDEEKKEYTDELEFVILEISSKATRHRPTTVAIPPEGYTLKLDDDDFEEISDSEDKDFPYVAFEGLTITPQTRRDSWDINYKGEANKVFLCDENGKPLQQTSR